MRGKITDSLPSVRGRIPDVAWRIYGAYGFMALVIILFVLGVAGTITGAGFFILAMIQMKYAVVASSAGLLAVSAATVVGIYLWATGAA